MPAAPQRSLLLSLCAMLLVPGLLAGVYAHEAGPAAAPAAAAHEPGSPFYCDQPLAARPAPVGDQAPLCRPGGLAAPAQSASPTYLPLIRQTGAAPGPQPGPGPGPEPEPVPPVANAPALLSAYLIAGPQPDYEYVRYRPRQFAAGLDLDPEGAVLRVDDAGAYAGWDVLNTPSREINTVLALERWVQLSLSRAASAAIVWRGGQTLPRWLEGWAPGAPVVIDGESLPTYTRALPAGDTWLGSVYDPAASSRPSVQTYLVLLAEAGGKPSAAPAVPAGLERPQPNQTCPAWVHDQYVTDGPDGESYRTWHPPIDPVFWCYFHHEHGSDPGGHRPAFGYTAAQSGVEERHEGFKVYRFLGAAGAEFVITHHFGTGSAAKAACVRFHTFDMAVYRGDEQVADIHVMADHGKSQHARSDADLTPPACPNQGAEADAEGSNGVRKFQVAALDPVGYEPWRIDFARVVVEGLDEFLVNTPSRIADCNTLQCDADVLTGDQGEFRFATYGPRFGIRAGATSGVFYTDPRGRGLVQPGEAGSVRQFVAPGASLTLPALGQADIECYQSHPFGGVMVCQQSEPLETNMNVEGSLRSPN